MKAIRVLAVGLVGAAIVCAGGCMQKYAVTDHYSQRVYFTRKVTTKDDGTTMFKDERSGENVTLRKAKVRSVSSGEFDQGVGK